MGEEVEELAEAFKRNRAAPVQSDEAMLHLIGWWERHRDDYLIGGSTGSHAAMEFAGMAGALFATVSSLRASLTRAEEEIAHVRTMMVLSWPPPLNQSMPDGTLPQQFRAFLDAEIIARRAEEEDRLSRERRTQGETP